MSQSKVVYTLSPETIDSISQSTFEALIAEKIPSLEATRIRLAIEEVLLTWLSDLGTVNCELSVKKLLKRMVISLSAAGDRADPTKVPQTDFDESLPGSNLLETMGVSPTYKYRNGINYVTFSTDIPNKNPLLRVLSILILSIALGLLLKQLPENTRQFISESILSPFCSAFLRLILTVACPMMFLSLVSGIVNIGDVATFNKVGGTLIKGYLSRLLIIATAISLLNLPFYSISFSDQSVSAVSLWGQIYNMFLNIIPSNIVEPFSTGNTLQIIFLAILTGAAILFLNKKVSVVIDFVEQLNSIVTFIMHAITTIVPAFIFSTVLNLFLTDNFASLSEAPLFILAVFLVFILVCACTLLPISVRFHISPMSYIRKTFSTTLIAMTTASSTAAFSNNAFDCEKNLGIDPKLVKFAVPLSVAIYKIGYIVVLTMEAFFMANLFSIAITPSFLITLILAAIMLTIAAPPVLGGGLVVYSVFFLTLGIPAEAVGIAAALDVVFDYFLTPTTSFCQQTTLTIIADKLGMLDKKILQNKTVINQ